MREDMIWRTRDGREIRVCDMDDDHLLNAHHFLCRKQADIDQLWESAYHPVFGPSPGTIAEDMVEQMLEDSEEWMANHCFWIQVFEEEIEWRNRNLKANLEPKPIPQREPLPEFELVEVHEHGKIWRVKDNQDPKMEERVDLTPVGVYKSYVTLVERVSSDVPPNRGLFKLTIRVLIGKTWKERLLYLRTVPQLGIQEFHAVLCNHRVLPEVTGVATEIIREDWRFCSTTDIEED